MEPSRFPNRLKKFRESLGYTQKEVSQILSLAHSGNISRWEKGYVLPSLIHLSQLSILYKTPISHLYNELWNLLESEIETKNLSLEKEHFITQLKNK